MFSTVYWFLEKNSSISHMFLNIVFFLYSRTRLDLISAWMRLNCFQHFLMIQLASVALSGHCSLAQVSHFYYFHTFKKGIHRYHSTTYSWSQNRTIGWQAVPSRVRLNVLFIRWCMWSLKLLYVSCRGSLGL